MLRLRRAPVLLGHLSDHRLVLARDEERRPSQVLRVGDRHRREENQPVDLAGSCPYGGFRGGATSHARTEHRDARHAAPAEVAHRCEHVLEERARVGPCGGASVAAEVDGQHLVPAAREPRGEGGPARLVERGTVREHHGVGAVGGVEVGYHRAAVRRREGHLSRWRRAAARHGADHEGAEERDRGQARIPPSTGNATPFTYDASSLARKSAASAMSSGRPTRPAGIDLRVRAKSASRPPSGAAKGSRIGVSVRPGQSALQRIPRAPYASATWRTSMMTPAFATWYAGLPALASMPATDAVVSRTPRPASSIGRRAARSEKKTPVRLTRSTSDHASVGCSAHGARTPAMPAFAHSTSIRPWRVRISATRPSTERSSPTSTVTATPPVSAATAAAASPFRSATTTRAPARAKDRTPAAPMPEPPPVTTHTRFWKSMRPA